MIKAPNLISFISAPVQDPGFAKGHSMRATRDYKVDLRVEPQQGPGAVPTSWGSASGVVPLKLKAF